MHTIRILAFPLAALAIVSCGQQEPVKASEDEPSTTVAAEPTRPALEFGVVSAYDFDKTIEVLKEATKAQKYGVMGEHKISEILAEKGFPRDRYTILEVCNPAMAAASLDMDLRAGLNMPCPVAIYEEDGEVRVMTFDTRALSSLYDGDKMSEIGASVYASMSKIIDSVDVALMTE